MVRRRSKIPSGRFGLVLGAKFLLLALVLLGGDAWPGLDDWPKYGRTLSNDRFSPLDQINRDNIAQLELAWSYRTGKKATFQSSPIVVGGVMYLTTPFNDVIALNAASGEEIWRYRHQLRKRKTCFGLANRGPAVGEDMVYRVTIDGRLIALERDSGRLSWEITLADPGAAQSEHLSSFMSLSQPAAIVCLAIRRAI